QASLANLLRNGSTINGYPYAGTSDAKIAYSDAIRAELSFAEQFGWLRDQSQNEQIYHDAKGLLLNNNHMQGLANIGNPAIYGLSGSLGATIRIAAAANGVLQASYGAQQAINGDAWNAAGNIAFGALGVVGSLGIPGAKPSAFTGAAEVPATSAIARVGLREDLAAQAGIPRNMVEAPANVWGKSIDDIQQSFKMDGAKLTYVPPKTGTSGNAQVYKVEGGTTGIKEIQYSPSTVDAPVKSVHVGEYYKITYVDGSKAKVIDPATYRPTFQGPSKPIYDANTTYLNPQGQKVKFNPVTNIWVSE
ncbi:hypothetical protein K5D67_19195, partial [Pseudomonas cichorii]|nr:hypothetical protein [Pseudomonas cichorii]